MSERNTLDRREFLHFIRTLFADEHPDLWESEVRRALSSATPFARTRFARAASRALFVVERGRQVRRVAAHTFDGILKRIKGGVGATIGAAKLEHLEKWLEGPTRLRPVPQQRGLQTPPPQ